MKKIIVSLLVIIVLFSAVQVQASATKDVRLSVPNPLKYALGVNSPDEFNEPTAIIASAIALVLMVVGSFALIFVIYGGIMILTSMGNAEKVQKAKGVIVWSIIGLALIISSYVILQLIFSTLKGAVG